MILIGRCSIGVLLSGLAGCVMTPLPQGPLPLVAVPGPNKSAAEFQQDDVACRTAAASPPPAAAAPTFPAKPGQAGAPDAAPDQSQAGAMAAGGVYLHCMQAHDNVVQPLAPVRPVVYAAYGYGPPYGPYDGYSTYPWLYDGYGGGGFYGGFFGVGYGGWHGGYGGHGERSGWGGHHR